MKRRIGSRESKCRLVTVNGWGRAVVARESGSRCYPVMAEIAAFGRFQDALRLARDLAGNESLDQLLLVGDQMATLCFNLSPHSGEHAETMRELYQQWDTAKRRMKKGPA